ncbi:hypothetical protein CSR02_10220 [Acetobacter pomorum]|uniref:DUF1134 domain-containing protein n=2 Tax=Acetobacter pomorum TaxID=65959 RepID=A0A2G4RCA0_9PROT|nr:hypothetical protein [Acetobacter pomorum]KDE21205.1 hypothetical protein AZ09_03640 [Acetobacter aceti 1023]PHY93375.1 hypothetical protein CSR02_10220 [Acetobacter pomorum]GBR49772.1 hypothetical protein AA11825_1466 [Acetobacter pomorum DSM 11825]
MRSASRHFAAALALCGAWFMPAGAETMLGPVTATVTFNTHSADLGVGYTWGRGVLTYGDRQYPFEIKGASAIAVGYSSGHSVGKVYNLQRIEDFEGTFWALSGEATVGRGIGGLLMENNDGVRIRLDQSRAGGRFAASPSRLTIHLLDKTGTPVPTASAASNTTH